MSFRSRCALLDPCRSGPWGSRSQLQRLSRSSLDFPSCSRAPTVHLRNRPPTLAPTTTVSPTTTTPPEATQTTVGATGSAVQAEEAKAELSAAILEIGEILELPVASMDASMGDTSTGMVMSVGTGFNHNQDDEFDLRIFAFETPEAASAWLRAETRLEDQHLTDQEWPEALALGAESGVWRRCGRGCTTLRFVRVGAHVIRVLHLEEFETRVVEAAMAALATEYSPRLGLGSTSAPALEAFQPVWIRVTATDKSGGTVGWQVPDPNWEEGVVRGDACHVYRESVDPVSREGAFEHFRVTSEGIHERGLVDERGLYGWGERDESEPPFDDIRALCDRHGMLDPIDPRQDTAPSHWDINDIVAVGDGSYSAVESVAGYRLDAEQVVSAGLLPADTTLTLVAADVSYDQLNEPHGLRLVVRGSHGAARDAFGLTFRELDPAETVTIEYFVHPG